LSQKGTEEKNKVFIEEEKKILSEDKEQVVKDFIAESAE